MGLLTPLVVAHPERVEMKISEKKKTMLEKHNVSAKTCHTYVEHCSSGACHQNRSIAVAR